MPKAITCPTCGCVVRAHRKVANRPAWDGVSLLRWGDAILKEFHRPAMMQKRILDEFESKGWPRRIENPLPRLSGVNRKQHLRDTIKNLNRGLTRKWIVFHADGSGLGIYWMPARSGGATSTPDLPHVDS